MSLFRHITTNRRRTFNGLNDLRSISPGYATFHFTFLPHPGEATCPYHGNEFSRLAFMDWILELKHRGGAKCICCSWPLNTRKSLPIGCMLILPDQRYGGDFAFDHYFCAGICKKCSQDREAAMDSATANIAALSPKTIRPKATSLQAEHRTRQ